MNTLIVVFPHQAGAQQGLLVLKEAQAEGTLALYGTAVLVKDEGGTLSLQPVDEGPFGLTVGALAGGFVGLPAGPVGAALGAAGGSTLGAYKELVHEQGRDSFLKRAASQIPPGWSAAVAEFAEFGDCRLEARMAALGGLVLRDVSAERTNAAAVRQLQEARARIDEAWADYEAAVTEAAAARDRHLAEARSRLADSAPRLKLLEAYMQAQMEAGIASLQLQAERADPGRRVELERQIAQLHSDYNQRRAQLEGAWTEAMRTERL
jgi:uncharacterized membrane protein